MPPAQRCPVIVNQTEYSIVVFQERGILFNKAVLLPGQAVGISRLQTGSTVLPYVVHAAIGDESSLPTRSQSFRNLVTVTAIPAAFIVGALATAASAGTLAGPSAALAPMVSGLVVQGVVIDSAAIAAGMVMASRAKVVSEFLMKKHPENFVTKSRQLFPGRKFVVVNGGVNETLEISTINQTEFETIEIDEFKEPVDTIGDKIKFYMPGMGARGKSNSSEIMQATDAVAGKDEIVAATTSK